MASRFTLFLLLFSLAHAEAQHKSKSGITGIWKGYFVQATLGGEEEKYRYEVQVKELDKGAIISVTYSYKTTVFYGKAKATGIYTKKTKNLLLKETSMVDLKISDPRSSACLMTCYLQYQKVGALETLTGTYTSVNISDKVDCGSGRVYLEKSPTSDFFKEDFLLDKGKETPKKVAPATPKATAPQKHTTPTAPIVKKKIIKPGAEDNLITNNSSKKDTNEDLGVEEVPKPKPPVKKLPKPEVIKNRDNELVKTIETTGKTIKVDLYDNGEIDGDRISVYHNNQLIVSNQTLTNKAISFTIKADEDDPVHEFVMVAENLGTIPPNTALMVITTDEKRYELFVTSTEKKNAVVRIEYKPSDENEKKK